MNKSGAKKQPKGTEYWSRNIVSGTLLYAMRTMRKKSLKEVAKMIGEDAFYLADIEKNASIAPPPIVGKYMTKLSITPSHVEQFKNIMSGKLKGFSETRTITAATKKKVREQCNNKCVICGSKEQLDFHHKEKYSKGGQNTADNLVLLCAACHAEEHKDEHYHNLMKSRIKTEEVTVLAENDG